MVLKIYQKKNLKTPFKVIRVSNIPSSGDYMDINSDTYIVNHVVWYIPNSDLFEVYASVVVSEKE